MSHRGVLPVVILNNNVCCLCFIKSDIFQMCSECWGRERGKNLQNSCIVESQGKDN